MSDPQSMVVSVSLAPMYLALEIQVGSVVKDHEPRGIAIHFL